MVDLELLTQCAIVGNVYHRQVLCICCVAIEHGLKPTQLPSALGSYVATRSYLELPSSTDALDGEHCVCQRNTDVSKHGEIYRQLLCIIIIVRRWGPFYTHQLGFIFNVVVFIGLTAIYVYNIESIQAMTNGYTALIIC
jgi:hypothetical protein